jgi:hypothetical protein
MLSVRQNHILIRHAIPRRIFDASGGENSASEWVVSPFEGLLLTCTVIQRSDTKIGSEGSYGTSG